MTGQPRPKRWVPYAALFAIVLIVAGTRVRQWWDARGVVSLAVLPFAGADDLRRTLASIEGVRVMGPVTSAAFKTAGEAGREQLARRLALDYLVTGASGAAALERVHGGARVWTGPVTEVNALLQAAGKTIEAPVKPFRISPTAERALRAVVALDALEGNAAALLDEARAAAGEALRADDAQPDAHLAKAVVLMLADHQWAEAELELRRALDLRPADALAARWYGHLLGANRKTADAVDAMGRALAVEPLAPAIALPLALSYINDERWDLARQHLARCSEEFPRHPAIAILSGLAARAQGDYAGAVAAWEPSFGDERTRRLSFALAAESYARLRNTAKARALVDQLPANTPPDLRGLALWGLGEQDEFYRLLAKALEEKSPTLVLFVSSPLSEPLRKDPRYLKILAALGVKQD